MIKQKKSPNRQLLNSSEIRKVLLRIRKANDFVIANEKSEELIEKARNRFKLSVIPECERVGISEALAWTLFYFGKNFIDRELKS